MAYNKIEKSFEKTIDNKLPRDLTHDHVSMLCLDAAGELFVIAETANGGYGPVFVGDLWIETYRTPKFPLRKAPVGTSFSITQGAGDEND